MVTLLYGCRQMAHDVECELVDLIIISWHVACTASPRQAHTFVSSDESGACGLTLAMHTKHSVGGESSSDSILCGHSSRA